MTNAYITLLTNEAYLPGALTVGQILKKDLKTKYTLVILLDTTQINEKLVEYLQEVYDEIIPIDGDLIMSPIDKLVSQLNRIELLVTFTKILLWKQVQYTKLVYLDCDVLPMQGIDELFEKEFDANQVVASPDSGWPDIFNTGVMVLKPSKAIFKQLSEFVEAEENTFDGADQGLFNEFFNIASQGLNWIRLPFVYNVTFSQSYQYLPAYHRFFKDIKIFHYIGQIKPWHFGAYDQFHQYWWDSFNKHNSREDQQYLLHGTNVTRGEAHQLSFEPVVNKWDSESVEDKINEPHSPAPSIFPWEKRGDRAQPSRVFNSFSTPKSSFQPAKRQIFSSKKATAGSSKSQDAKKAYEFNEHFDPEESLNKVSKLPIRMLNKKRETDAPNKP